ncbi:DUF4411 family protein [Acidimicrobiaceae bacterium AH-315-P05]|nr:DUF4411 family protein [Acidimicrobiaceae bacterium AH-315-P05]
MAYLLDSDVFIRAKNDHYGFDFCLGFWEWLVQANAAGRVHSVEAVYGELVGSDDELAQWVKDHRSFFLPLTADEISSVAAVNRWANDSPDYEPAAKSEFAAAADSFLIAHAVAGGHTVVTHERISDGRRKIKIPNAAIANGVSVSSPFQMLRAERVRLVLAPIS